ncbi:hypothetical protein IKF21_00745, partial [Candidatus Saccharibacteria bacterium]|nr:hypothetical protein [Candidatus Saccharibacteria bacterium]
VSSVQVRTASGTGGTLKGTVSSSGGYVSGLTYNTAYYLYPTFSSGYEFSSWAKTSGSGTLSSTSASNPTFTMGAGNGTVTITGKVSPLPMQSLTLSNCSTSGTIVRDTRDNEVYLAKKLADGKCWLLDNLRLDLTNSAVLNSLTTSNTNVNSASLLSLKSGNRSAGYRYANNGIVSWNSSPGRACDTPKVQPDYKDVIANKTYGPGSGKMGVFYNYCAATAGDFCYGEGESGVSNSNTTYGGAPSGNPNYDICPSGWRMPKAGSNSEYTALYTAYSSNVINTLTALSVPLAGDYSGSGNSVSSNGYRAYIWASTFSNYSNSYTDSMFAEVFSDSNRFNGNSTGSSRYDGYNVRCILK